MRGTNAIATTAAAASNGNGSAAAAAVRNVRVQNNARPPPLPGGRLRAAGPTPRGVRPHPPAAPGQATPFPALGMPPPAPLAGPVPPAMPPAMPPPSAPAPRHSHFASPVPRPNPVLQHLPDLATLHIVRPGQAALAKQFAGDAVRAELSQAAFLRHAQLPAGEAPDMLGGYHSLAPLEDWARAEERPSAAFGVCTAVLKGVSAQSGHACALRRIDGKQLPPTADLLQVKSWG